MAELLTIGEISRRERRRLLGAALLRAEAAGIVGSRPSSVYEEELRCES
jgi:hypothetical protein